MFVRSGQVAEMALPGFSFGCNQMMGFWNVDTAEQYSTLNADLIGAALLETSVSLKTVTAILTSAAESAS